MARRWRTRPKNIRAMIRRGELAAFLVNGQVRIAPETVAAAEAGPLAVKPMPKKQRRESIPREVLALLED